MAKYHISADGTPGLCRATVGKCPLGGEGEHYSSEQEAYEASQKIMESNSQMFTSGEDVSPEDTKLTKEMETLNAQLDRGGMSTKESDALRTRISELNEKVKGSGYNTTTIGENLSGVSEPDGGATFNMNGTSPTTGFCASPYPEHSKVFESADEVTPASLAKYVNEVNEADPNVLSGSNSYLGLWNDPDTGKIYLDVSKHYKTAEEARVACEENDQIAFFDLNRFESVTVDPNAKSGQ